MGLRTAIMRVGQLVGDSEYGIWNETEAIPLMIKVGPELSIFILGANTFLQGGEVLGVMPLLDEVLSRTFQSLLIPHRLVQHLSWLPVNQAAAIMTDLLSVRLDLEDPLSPPCWHVVQPHRIAWSTVLQHLDTNNLSFCSVPTTEWLQSLRVSNPDPLVNREYCVSFPIRRAVC
jgi:hypothetical protein